MFRDAPPNASAMITIGGGAAFFVAFLATLRIANNLADKKYGRELTPEAKLRR